MTGEELVDMADEIRGRGSCLEDIGYDAGEGELSDEQLDEVMAIICQISRTFDTPERDYSGRVFVKDPDRKHDARREEAMFEKREKNSN